MTEIKNPYHHNLAKTPISAPEYFVPGCLACAFDEGVRAHSQWIASQKEAIVGILVRTWASNKEDAATAILKLIEEGV